ncbi:expressed protein [Phakopsora pachyrhizi]|uniref:Expressed protein n=1 Tax=Phakopsora pachyrhizi TaxID=170000 RepID=A0AAV0BSE4_PHAPC|nr:expressed protein [Phakopsora pachyrhizi]
MRLAILEKIRLRNENISLKGQGTFRRRQSVIPVSALSRGLAMFCGGTDASDCVDSYQGMRPMYERHSIDCGALHHLANNKLLYFPSVIHDPGQYKDLEGEEEKHLEFDTRPLLSSSIFHNPRSLFFGQHVPGEAPAPHTIPNCRKNSQSDLLSINDPDPKQEPNRTDKLTFQSLNTLSPRQESPAWFSVQAENTNVSSEATGVENSKPFLTTASQAQGYAPKISPKQTDNQFPISVGITSFLPALNHSPFPPYKSRNLNFEKFSEKLEYSSTECNIEGSPPHIRRSSFSSSSGSSASNSVFLSSELCSSGPNMSSSATAEFASPQRLFSSQISASTSPTYTGSSPDRIISNNFFQPSSSAVFLQSPFEVPKTES